MELLKNLGTKKNKNGNYQSFGIFLCQFCLIAYIKDLGNGKKAKSCGCIKNVLISILKKGQKRTEDSKRKQSETLMGHTTSEETRQKLSESKRGNKNPMYGVKTAMYGKKHTEEAIQKIKEKRKLQISPMKGRIGELSPFWQGGKSFEPYSPEFNKQKKQQILERDSYTCQCTDCEHKTNNLDIHHIDYDKLNNIPENLITLCDSCHMKTNGKNKRQYWTEFYQNIMENKINV